MKKFWVWTAVDWKSKKLVGYVVSKRGMEYFESLPVQLEHIELIKYATNTYDACAYIYDLKMTNRLFRHFLGRFTTRLAANQKV